MALLQEHLTARRHYSSSSCIWAIRPPFPNRCFPTQNLHPSQQCRGCCRGGGFSYSPAGVPLLCAQLIGKHTQSSSMRLFHLVLKTILWNKADQNKEEKTQNGQGQAIWNQSWSHYFNLTFITSSEKPCLHSALLPQQHPSVKLCTPCWDQDIMAARKHLAHHGCYCKVINNT